MQQNSLIRSINSSGKPPNVVRRTLSQKNEKQNRKEGEMREEHKGFSGIHPD